MIICFSSNSKLIHTVLTGMVAKFWKEEAMVCIKAIQSPRTQRNRLDSKLRSVTCLVYNLSEVTQLPQECLLPHLQIDILLC